MPRHFTHASPAIPARTSHLDRRLMARANAQSAQRRHPDLVRETYAGCDRAPYGWENANG